MGTKEALVNGGTTFVHPAALCESTSVGEGTRIWAFAHVLEGAIVGAECNLGDHTFVEGGVTIGNRVTLKNGVAVWDGVVLYDDVFVGPNAVFTNDLAPRAAPHRTTAESLLPTVVRRGATIGANATIVCGVTIGAHALIGAGAVVTADVPSHGIVVGVPARQIGWICCCGVRLSPPCRCRCGRELRVTAHGLRVVAPVMQR
jgi:acetyltransferase-like isoleucine patch superfamily enzyme